MYEVDRRSGIAGAPGAPGAPGASPATTVTLAEVAAALDAAVRELVVDAHAHATIATVALAEASDLAAPTPLSPRADLVLPVGVSEALTATWLARVGHRDPSERPKAVVIKEDIDSPGLRELALGAGIGLIVVDRMARWDLLLTAVNRRLQRAHFTGVGIHDAGANAAFNDLAELASVIAAGSGGMVTIERPDSSVLAYSPSDGTADGLRARAILGRAAPEDSMVLLGQWGVMRKIQTTREVVRVPAHEELGMRPRLVTGIHSPTGQFIGSIWVQEGAQGFSDDAETVVRGGASAASRVLTRELEAPSASEMMLQRVFGEHGGTDAGTAAAFLGLPALGDAAVMGIALPRDAAATHTSGQSLPPGSPAPTGLAADAKLLRLHIGAFAPQARFALLGDRAYVLLPNLQAIHRLHEWAEQLVAKFDARADAHARSLRIAIVAPIAGFAEVAAARLEADRVLDAIAGSGRRVTSLTQARTSVLLREAMALLAARPELADPRIASLTDYDGRHRADLLPSLRAYVECGFNAREAARQLGIHPNTLRYRLGRAEELTGIDLARADDRLLVSLQLAMEEARD
ncbi:PucR family transcriptional regulator [Leucobacter albus]|uniref:PucR family transcriptional regulator n=1 Tax=Leucobacter albus TaxID=272210 RepID=A0ABW3TQE8_9MICO